jgi:hypothetical protein
MAEEKTKKYYVRLIKGFTLAQGHRRAGLHFLPGPTAQEVELTKEQLEQIKADPSLEIVTSTQAAKLDEAAATLSEQDVSDPGDNAVAKPGRNYDTGVNGGLANTATVITDDNKADNQNNNIGVPGGGDNNPGTADTEKASKKA